MSTTTLMFIILIIGLIGSSYFIYKAETTTNRPGHMEDDE